MQPFSRETITDRRQPYVRWTAVIAGALVALGTWMLLQLLLTGGALSAIDPEDIDDLRGVGIGTGIGSVLAPLLAMFIGGLVAGRLAAYYDRKISAFHGVLVWTIASVVGLALLGSAIDSLVSKRSVTAHAGDMAAPPPGASDFIDTTVDSINIRQVQANAPEISKDDFLDAARHAFQGRETFDRNAFITRLDEQTGLSRPEAENVLSGLGNDANDVMIAADQLALHRERALDAAEDAGKGMLAAGFGLLLCLVAAAGGALLGSNMLRGRHGGGGPGRHARDPRDPRDPGDSRGARELRVARDASDLRDPSAGRHAGDYSPPVGASDYRDANAYSAASNAGTYGSAGGYGGAGSYSSGAGGYGSPGYGSAGGGYGGAGGNVGGREAGSAGVSNDSPPVSTSGYRGASDYGAATGSMERGAGDVRRSDDPGSASDRAMSDDRRGGAYGPADLHDERDVDERRGPAYTTAPYPKVTPER